MRVQRKRQLVKRKGSKVINDSAVGVGTSCLKLNLEVRME